MVSALSNLVDDLFFLLIGLSFIIDLVIFVASLRARRIKKVRILGAVSLSSGMILIYLAGLAFTLLGYISINITYASILLVFLLVVTFYAGIMRGMR